MQKYDYVIYVVFISMKSFFLFSSDWVSPSPSPLPPHDYPSPRTVMTAESGACHVFLPAHGSRMQWGQVLGEGGIVLKNGII